MIRKARMDDLIDLHILLDKFYQESRFKDVIGSEWDDETMFRWVAFIIQAPNYLVSLAEEDGKIVGCMIAEVANWHTNYNDAVVFEQVWYVLPEFRGNGHAKALVDALEAWAKEHKAKAVEMGTGFTMREKATSRLMTRLGYKKTRTIHTKRLEDDDG